MDERDRVRKKAWKVAERKAARKAFPLADEDLEELFTHVSESVEQAGCDHSLRATQKWIANRQVDHDAVIKWLETNGGYCDCEVVANVADHWEQNR